MGLQSAYMTKNNRWNSTNSTWTNQYCRSLQEHWRNQIVKVPVQGLAGLEFTAARMVLCFAFVAKTVLVMHPCFGYR